MKIPPSSTALNLVVLALSLTSALLIVSVPNRVRTEPTASESSSEALPASPAYDKAYSRARQIYNTGDYRQAIDAFISAIQIEPLRADAYRDLARAYFWEEELGAALAYYDHYMALASPQERAAIAQERQLVASRSPQTKWSPTTPQLQTKRALQNELKSGSAYTPGGGGAWGLYQTLVRVRYAQPDLADLQQQLRTKLLEEFDAALQTSSEQPVPRLDDQGWSLQGERLEALRQLALTRSVDQGELQKRRAIVDAVRAILNGQYAQATELAQFAVQLNPETPFVRWYRVIALLYSERYATAREELQAWRNQTKAFQTAGLHPYLDLLSALLHERQDHHSEAVQIYLRVISDVSSTDEGP